MKPIKHLNPLYGFLGSLMLCLNSCNTHYIAIASDGHQWMLDLQHTITEVITSDFSFLDTTDTNESMKVELLSNNRIIVQISINQYGKTRCDTIFDRNSMIGKDVKERIKKHISSLRFKEVNINERYIYKESSDKELIKRYAPFRFTIPVRIDY